MKKRKYITAKLLERIPACADGLKAFNMEFPSGRATWQQIIATAGKSHDHAAYVAWLGRLCPAGVEGATWPARLALQQDGEERALLGCQCPAGVEGATWTARLALQRDDEERARLGRICPAGVEGATWEARMSVQEDDYGRAWLAEYCPDGVEGATLEARLAVRLTDDERAYVMRWYGMSGSQDSASSCDSKSWRQLSDAAQP